MIYFFCNQKYGLPLLLSTVEYSQQYKLPITIVFSEKKSSEIEKNYYYKLKKSLRSIYLSNKYSSKVILSPNINLEDFCQSISLESHGIVAGFNQIFKNKIIKKFRSLVNFHPSILPLYRGPVPSYWCLKNKEIKTGFTLHKVTKEIDKGDILYQDYIEINSMDNQFAIDQKIAKKAIPCLLRYLDFLRTNEEWNTVRLDASQIYHSCVDYASFPQNQP